ncbi:biotin-independent malonate decarboxylase subunit gamma [Lichenicoccus sp.]|uniref:biotin-independent malonate decarboxylase subunit gamma n=1 Tax=Lichenicoccus sp. TaxID=2781899 RepID=UPI003D0F5CC9
MTRDELVARLFPHGARLAVAGGVLTGTGAYAPGREAVVLGAVDGVPLGGAAALALAGAVLEAGRQKQRPPIVMLVDAGSQAMRREEELLGLNEHLAHLAKCLLLAAAEGQRTVGVLYGRAAAGALIATALACDTLVALPEASPAVMDLPSIARVTKLDPAMLERMASETPIFAPGLAPLVATGAIDAVWDPDANLAALLRAVLDTPPGPDRRASRGTRHGGRTLAAAIATRVEAAARDG